MQLSSFWFEYPYLKFIRKYTGFHRIVHLSFTWTYLTFKVKMLKYAILNLLGCGN